MPVYSASQNAYTSGTAIPVSPRTRISTSGQAPAINTSFLAVPPLPLENYSEKGDAPPPLVALYW
jgi:hypothetical protein